MLCTKTWLCAVVSLLVLTSAFFIALPRAFASPGLAQKPVPAAFLLHARASAHQSISAEEGLCSYSTNRTSVIIDSEKWNRTTYFCGEGYLGHEIDHANDIYDNGGGPMWVKWYAGPQGHFCSISGLGAYWEFPTAVKITQVAYGTNHRDSYCP